MSERVYIGLGSNLSEPLRQLQSAIEAIRAIPATQVAAVSPFYISDPLGPADQPRYVNAVAALDTELAPLALLDALQAIELEQGRVRKDERWGPRTLDLDLLLFGVFELPWGGLEVSAGLARHDFDVFAAEASRGAAAIHRGVADADDQHALADFFGVTEGDRL